MDTQKVFTIWSKDNTHCHNDNKNNKRGVVNTNAMLRKQKLKQQRDKSVNIKYVY